MTFFDWFLIWVPITCAMGLALYVARFNKSVVDFIAAGRCAGRYLLATAGGEAGSGAVTAIALFQMTTKTGFAFQFWGPLYSTIPVLLGLIGWVSYRARETRVLSGGQFFEIRYSRPFRLFMGVMGFVSGMLAAGVGPAVGARFLVFYLNLPDTLWIGGMGFATWQIVALGYLSVSLTFVLLGGQISVLISDCLEGMFSLIGYVIIIITLLVIFGWSHIAETITAQPPGKSMVNPFDMKDTPDFNIYFIFIALFHSIWHTPIGASSARNPHEQRMAGILGTWRGFGFALMRTMVAICALVFLQNPDFASQSADANAQWNAIQDKGVHDQMQVPIAASHYFPPGLKGLFCAIMFMGLMAGDAAGFHGRGSGFIQDIVLPIRNFLKLPMMSPRHHMLYLRMAATGVAAFGFCFSSFYTQTQAIQLFWQVTSAVYGSGAGAVIVFGLYWKRGTQQAAWTTMILSASIALTSIYLQQHGHSLMFHGQDLLHGQYAALFTTLCAITTYVTISLLTCRQPFNMDKMLHRGKYAVAGEKKKVAPTIWQRFSPAKIIGIDEEFTFWDRVIAFGIFSWIWGLFGISMFCLVWNIIAPWDTQGWVNYWFIFGLCVPLTMSIFTCVWFTIGGTREIMLFIHNLRHEKRDDRDDGTVGPGHPV